MSTSNKNAQLTEKQKVIQDSKALLEEAELWTLVRTDKDGSIHVHADSQVNFLALMLCVFKEEPDLKEDLDMMLKLEAQQAS